MKLGPLKIGQVVIATKMLLSLICALLVLGIGIGTTIALPDNSQFTLLVCSSMSLLIIGIL